MRLTCWLFGHDWNQIKRSSILCVECERCGAQSSGLSLHDPAYRVTQPGDPARHRLRLVPPPPEHDRGYSL